VARHEVQIAPRLLRTIPLAVSHQEFFLIKSAVEELLNDSDLVWGNCDEPEDSRLYEEAKRLADRLETIEQTVVIPH
jgi:hypothetical protein